MQLTRIIANDLECVLLSLIPDLDAYHWQHWFLTGMLGFKGRKPASRGWRWKVTRKETFSYLMGFLIEE